MTPNGYMYIARRNGKIIIAACMFEGKGSFIENFKNVFDFWKEGYWPNLVPKDVYLQYQWEAS